MALLFSSQSMLFAQRVVDEGIEFRGQILGVNDSLPIPFVNIYTEGYEKFASSSAGGNFSIKISETDTLNFSAVGFRPQQLLNS